MRPIQRFTSPGITALVLTIFTLTPAHSQTTSTMSDPSATSTSSEAGELKDAQSRRKKLQKENRAPRAKDGAKSTAGQADMQGMDHGDMKGMDHGDMKGMDQGGMKGMDHGDMKGMDHGDMKGMDHGDMKGMDHGGSKAMDHSGMPGMEQGSSGMADMGQGGGMAEMGAMQGGRAPADARDPDVYADGLTMGPMPGMDMADNEARGLLLVDQLEQYNGRRTRGQTLDLQGWYGTDLNKLWIKVDGERSEGRLGAVRTEALYDRAISTYWGLQAGVRHDFGDGPGRNWAAFGVQGLAPYWFDVEATAYVGEGGRTALRFEAEYDILFTQRLILQPNVKLDIYGKSDPRREIGSGLSQAEAALRLRYEFSRKFAPYVGVVFATKFGNTARLTREDGGRTTDLRAVAGIRVWY